MPQTRDEALWDCPPPPTHAPPSTTIINKPPRVGPREAACEQAHFCNESQLFFFGRRLIMLPVSDELEVYYFVAPGHVAEACGKVI